MQREKLNPEQEIPKIPGWNGLFSNKVIITGDPITPTIDRNIVLPSDITLTGGQKGIKGDSPDALGEPQDIIRRTPR